MRRSQGCVGVIVSGAVSSAVSSAVSGGQQPAANVGARVVVAGGFNGKAAGGQWVVPPGSNPKGGLTAGPPYHTEQSPVGLSSQWSLWSLQTRSNGGVAPHFSASLGVESVAFATSPRLLLILDTLKTAGSSILQRASCG